MNQSSTEKNGWSAQIATRVRPVTRRASFTAAVTASEPFLANFTISAPGTRWTKSSAAASSRVVGRVKLRPSSSTARTPSITGA